METTLWVGFLLMILGILFLDLSVFHRRSRILTTKEALSWTLFWVLLASLFTFLVYFIYQHNVSAISGSQAALQFFTAYLLEKSLSLDNIFVMALIFSYFQIPLIYQHRVLFWGILGVLLLRFFMIMLGLILLSKFYWINYVFGIFLVYTAAKMITLKKKQLSPINHPVIALLYRKDLVTQQLDKEKFFTKIAGKWKMTPLFVALIIIETSDVLFALDSIPAVFAITTDPFLVFTSNIFAIMGLRSLYFVIANLMKKFVYIEASLACLLAFIGFKMLLAHHFSISTLTSLIIILAILAGGIIASLYKK